MFVHETFGWSGKYVNRHLQPSCEWAVAAEMVEAMIEEIGKDLGFSYRGVELDNGWSVL